MQLVDMWAKDVWTVQCKRRKGVYTRSFCFEMPSPSLKIECKYALWRYIEESTSERATMVYYLHSYWRHLAPWFNQVALSAHSFLEKDLEVWVISLRTYLVEHGLFKPNKTKRLKASQQYIESDYDDRRIYFFRVL